MAKPESIFTPLLSCIQACLLIELIALWRGGDAVAVAIVCRLMILLFILLVYYFKSREKYEVELNLLLCIVAVQDVFMAILFRGLLNLYSYIMTYIPVVVLLCLHYKILDKSSLLKWLQDDDTESIV